MPEQNSDLQQIRNIIIRYLSRWYIFAICVALCLILAGLYYISVPKSYKVTSLVMIKSDDNNTLQPFDMFDGMGMMGTQRATDDEIEIIHSKTLIEHTVRHLDIQTLYYHKKGLRWVEQYPNHSVEVVYPPLFGDTARTALRIKLTRREQGYKMRLKYGKKKASYTIDDISQPLQTIAGTLMLNEVDNVEKGDKFTITFLPLPLWAERYQSEITVSAVKRESNVVRLSATSRCVPRTIDMLNTLVELYNDDAVEYKNRMALATALFIDDRLNIISKELADVETDVEKYKKDNHITDLQSESALFLETANTYQQRMAEIETQRSIVGFVRDYIQQTPDQLIPANLGIEDQGLVTLVQSYNTDMLTRQRLQRSTTADNPVITQLDNRLQTLRENLTTTIDNVLQSLAISYDNQKSKEAAFMARIRTIPQQEREYIEIKRQQQIKESIYLYLIKKREENALTLASTLQPARVIDNADFSRKAVAPRLMLLIFVAAVAGLGLGLFIIFALDMIFNTIESREEYERLVTIPFAGEICNSRSKKHIVVSSHNTSSTAELFRLLRTNMLFMLRGKQHPVVLITSTQTGEGKSFIAANLAASLALTGKKILLAGLDIRSPQLSNYIGLGTGGHLTEYLAGTISDPAELIIPYPNNHNLDIAPAGAIPPNPGELLMSDRLTTLIEQWRTQYDIIILDSAPVGMVSDTYLLSHLPDITLYVSRIGLTPRHAAEFIQEQVRSNKLPNIVGVLNGVPAKSRYGYGYGYGYGSNNDND